MKACVSCGNRRMRPGAGLRTCMRCGRWVCRRCACLLLESRSRFHVCPECARKHRRENPIFGVDGRRAAATIRPSVRGREPGRHHD